MQNQQQAPANTEWRGNTLHGRIRIMGRLRRWSLRTDDVEVARARVVEDIARLKAETFYGDRPALAMERRKWRNCPTLAEFFDPPPSPRGYAYVVGFRDYVKIGWSATVKARLIDLQNNLPENLVVYGVLEGTRDDEQWLHGRFRHLRISREWFRLGDPLEGWVDAGCPALPGLQKSRPQESHLGVAVTAVPARHEQREA